MKWDSLKKVFSDFQAGKVSKKYLINVIKEYQFTNNIIIKDKKTVNCK